MVTADKEHARLVRQVRRLLKQWLNTAQQRRPDITYEEGKLLSGWELEGARNNHGNPIYILADGSTCSRCKVPYRPRRCINYTVEELFRREVQDFTTESLKGFLHHLSPSP